MSENTMRLWNECVTGGRVRPKHKITAKTASYTITPYDFGSVFTTRGAVSEVDFTLPAASEENKGDWVLFINLADVTMYVLGAAGGLVAFNDLTADNIGYGDSGEKIGGMLLGISDGTSWLMLPIATETQTLSVNATSTATSTGTATGTSTSTSTKTSTSTATATSTGTPTSTSSSSATWSISGSDTASHTQSASATASATSTATATSTKTATPTATGTKTSTATSTGSSTATATGTP